jgi:hypothetical protein
MKYQISNEDSLILREAAKTQMNYANSEKNMERIKEWTAHNSLRGSRPLVQLELATFEHEILPQRLKCKGVFAREVEAEIYRNFLNQELFDDDRVTPAYYGLPYDTWFTLFGIKVNERHLETMDGSESVGRQFIPSLSDLEDDFDNGRIGKTDFGVDVENTLAKKTAIEEAIGDILPVKLKMDCLYSVPTQMIVHIMSMEDMMLNMFDYPELFQKMMQTIADDTLAYYRMLEEKNLILPTVGHEMLGNGSWCYNDELPGEDVRKQRPLTTKDVWGFMDSQETVGVSPAMFKELVFPCYRTISEQFGLLSYGCCEPVNPIWESCLSKLKNLRKLSISPWCDERYMGEQLRGTKVIYFRKPSPNYLGVGTTLDEDAVRKSIDTTLEAARGCHLEFAQRDVYTINHDVGKARRYVDIIKEEIADKWK